ncbi:nucleotidyltransferase domain-containing protein [Candidatus Woesearchaeota archaeon]|nr:nucleotidyltransferase domain-containing protein [Candidatus Woesearchaeota archaeon]
MALTAHQRTRIASLRSGLLARLKPSPATHAALARAVDATAGRIAAALKGSGIPASVVVGGSFAKRTYLADDYDIDLFVAFPRSFAEKDLPLLLGRALDGMGAERVHGSRDYFQLRVGGVTFEVVPVLEVKGAAQARNVTDMSPLHVAWVKRHPLLADDIILAKAFCKAQGVYGAESYIGGFSGHVVDILIVHHKGFAGLVDAARRWRPKTVIDTLGHHQGRALMRLNRSKIASPIVVVDPLQPERNAAAAVSDASFARFVEAAKAFCTCPSPSFFERPRLTREALAAAAGSDSLFIVKAGVRRAKEDIAGSRIAKAYEHVKAGVVKEGFALKASGWTWDKGRRAFLWYIVKAETLPPTKEIPGPPLDRFEGCVAFRRAHGTVHTEDGRLVAVVRRQHRTPGRLIAALIAQPAVRSRLASASLVPLPSYAELPYLF